MVRRGQISGSKAMFAPPFGWFETIEAFFCPKLLSIYILLPGEGNWPIDTSEDTCQDRGRKPCQTVRRTMGTSWARSDSLIGLCILMPWVERLRNGAALQRPSDGCTLKTYNNQSLKYISHEWNCASMWSQKAFCGRLKGLCCCFLFSPKHQTCSRWTLKRAIQEFVLDLFINTRINNTARSGRRKSGLSGFSSARKEVAGNSKWREDMEEDIMRKYKRI